MDHFNKLTPAEAERLAILAEECSEVGQIIGKVLRHGYLSYHPDNPSTSNRQLLEKEIGHVQAACKMLTDVNDISPWAIRNQALIKERKIKKYLHHQ